MKHLLLIGFAFLALNAHAQKIDTVKNAILVNPVQINSLTKDSVFQLGWSVFGINRKDTVSGANSYVQLYSRTGKRVQEMNVAIPYSVLAVWLEDVVIDDYILKFLGLTKKK